MNANPTRTCAVTGSARPVAGGETPGTGAAPRSGKALILATKAYTAENRLKSWWVVLSTLALLAVSTCLAIWLEPWPLRMLFALVSGLLMVRVFVIYHDHQHHAILDNSKAADLLMQGVGILALTPSSVWKSSHNYHHNHNSKLRGAHIGSYPIMTHERYEQSPWRERLAYLGMRHPLTIFCGYLTTFMMAMSILPFVEKPREHYDGILALILHLEFGVLLWMIGGWSAVFFGMLIPFWLAAALGAYLFYAQHNFPDVVFKDSAGWTYEGAALESSSFFTMPRWMHWFTANIGYHHIHHLNSRIPFYRLPEVMRDLPELQSPKTTSFWPSDVVRCLRLKVWDSKAGQMVSLRFGLWPRA